MKGMQRVSRGKSFSGVCDYALEDGRGQVIGGNMSATDSGDLAREFQQVRALRPDIEKAVWHNSLRLPAGERITEQRWRQIADDYMQRMGFTDQHQRVYFLHDDPAGQHIHIVANRIGADGSVYLGRNENLISTKQISELEKSHGLQITKGATYDQEGKTVMPDQRQVKRGEIEIALQTGEQPARMQLQQIVKEATAGKPTTAEFIERLESAGVTVRANVASTGRMNGFSFEYQGIPFKGSDLGKQYTWKSLEGVIDYEQTRDRQILADRRPGAASGAEHGAERGTSGESHQADGRSHGQPERREQSHPGRDPGASQGAAPGARESREALDGDREGANRRAQEVERGPGSGAPARPGAAVQGLELGDQGRSRVRVVGDTERAIYELSAPAAAGADHARRAGRGAAPGAVSQHVEAKVKAWRQQHAALDAPAYRITLVGRREGMPEAWNLGKSKDGGDERLWSAAEIEEKIPQLSRQNARGFDVYITPLSNDLHYLLVDDMKPGALDALKREGFTPALVQQSSAGNQQAVLVVQKLGRPDEQSLANSVMSEINRQYGDPKISGAIHPFRMAGFANKKPGKADSFTRVLEASGRPCKRAQEALEAARDAQVVKATSQRLQIATETPLSTIKGASEYDQVYLKTARQLKDQFADRANWSAIDFRCGVAIMKAGGDESDVRSAIERCSPALADRHGASVESYLARTVQAAANEYDRLTPRRSRGMGLEM